MARSGFLAVLVAIHLADTAAVSSRECMWRVRHTGQLTDLDPQCPARGLCGTVPDSGLSFYDRLSPHCARVIESYRSRWSEAGVSNLISHQSTVGCEPAKLAGASQPLLVASNDTAPFMLCTVPKAGCTNIRKLLHTMLSHPAPPQTDALAQFQTVHVVSYPAVVLYDLTAGAGGAAAAAPRRRPARRRLASDGVLWRPEDQPPAARGMDLASVPDTPPTVDDDIDLPPAAPDATQLHAAMTSADINYDDSEDGGMGEGDGGALPPPERLPAHVPSFTFGRNPYMRLLSGFRDKMVANPLRLDQNTVGNVNMHLQQDRSRRWPDTPAGFQEFVRALFEKGVTAVDGHFQPLTEMCGGGRDLRFDFYLRLEDMATWFPCWMDGLGLRGWTETGWSASSQGVMYLGRGVVDKFVTLKSYGAKRRPPAWNESSGRATWGERGVDWDLLSGDRCWWAPPGMTCEEYYASFTAADGSVVPGAAREGGASGQPADAAAGRKRDGHDTDAQRTWTRFFGQETADLAYLLYARDFEVFGYERAVIDAFDA